MSSTEQFEFNEVSDQELMQIPIDEIFEWDSIVTDAELMDIALEMIEFDEVTDEELMNIPMNDFEANDVDTVDMELGDSEIVEGILDCDTWNFDETMFDYVESLVDYIEQLP